MADTIMDRRKLLGAGALGLGLAACGASEESGNGVAAPAVSRSRQRLNMVTTWPKGLPGLGRAAERVAERIETLSDGNITVKVYAAGELVPALSSFDAVADGTADMYHGAEYYWQPKSKAFSFFTAVPMGMTAQEIMGWIDFGGGQALWEELSGQFGIIAFQGANTGHQLGGWFRREIASLEDFKGLKMRIPGLGGDVIRALGGAAVTKAGGEIFQALQTGEIDATEWVGPWNDFYLGFYREAPFYYGPGFHEPGASLAVGMNRRTWDGLAPTQQAIVRAACSEVNHLSLGEFTYENARHLSILTEEHGTQLRRFNDEIMSRVQEIARDVRSDAGAGGDIEKRIYESFEAALKQMRKWGNISEGPYYAARELGG
ncbi:MAG: TRAP transporter substrate-binding protein [Pseudomonadota bacterium]